MKNLLLLLIFIGGPLFSQNEKGIVPVSSPKAEDTGITRAVVVGISDYQDEGISDLKYADRDALAFVEWLQSPAGGALPPDNIQLLLNENATAAKFDAAMGWLIEHSREGDQAIIYFSGHGDVDSKIMGEEGFLLFWDTPFQSYRAGAYSIHFLKLVISTLSLQNKAKVLMIADACHSGKLAGNPIGGAQITNENLRQQFANETKILSCQPNEVSLESEEWGGGRGVFSYYFVDGLYGLADGNTDDQVTISEMDRYLEDHVAKAVYPMEQTPMVIGDKKVKLATVLPEVLALWKKGKTSIPASFKPIELKGIEEETLAKVDSNINELYYAFKQALKDKVFLEPVDSCANAYYEKLMAVAELKPFHGAMTRNFAAALQDDAQQWINKFMQSTIVGSEWNHPKGYGRNLAKAAELLGEEHYLYNVLKGREWFFNARDVFLEGRRRNAGNEFFDLVEQYSKQGLEFDDKAPYLYFILGYKPYYSPDKNDKLKAIELFKKAIEFAPSWIRAYSTIGQVYSELQLFKSAGNWIKKAMALDVDEKDPYLKENIAYLYYMDHMSDAYKHMATKIVAEFESLKKFDDILDWKAHCYWCFGYLTKAEVTYKKCIDDVEKSGDEKAKEKLGSLFYGPYSELGLINIIQGDLEEAEYWLEKRTNQDDFPNRPLLGVWNGWGFGLRVWLAYEKGEFDTIDSILEQNGKKIYPAYFIEDLLFLVAMYDKVDYAIYSMHKALEYFPENADLHYHLARLYLEQKNDYEKGLPLLEKAVQLDTHSSYSQYHLATAYAHLGRNDGALEHLEKALENGYEDFEDMEKDARWDALRGTERYQSLLAKNKPD